MAWVKVVCCLHYQVPHAKQLWRKLVSGISFACNKYQSDLSPIDWFASHIKSYYKRNLKIGHLHVNSIYSKVDEDLLNTCQFNIFFAAESKIDGLGTSTLFAHSEYCLIRRDRKKGGDGMLVYIRRSITALRRARLEPDGVESICLDVKGSGNSWFLICAC